MDKPLMRPPILRRASTKQTLGRMTASYAYTVTAVVTNLVSIPVFLHFLGQSEFGAWIVASTIAGYSLLLQLGIAQATANRFAEELHRANDRDAVATLSTGFWANGRVAFPAAIVVLAGYITSRLIAPDLTTLQLCLLATGLFLVDLPFSVIGVCCRTAGHVTMYQVAASVNLVLRAAAGALVLAIGAGATGLVVTQAAVGVVFHAVMWLVLRRTLPTLSLHRRHRDHDIRKAMRADSAGFLAIHFAGTVVFALDAVVIAVALGSGDVTPYAIAQRMLMLLAGIVSSTAAVFYPDLVAAKAKRSVDDMRRVFARMSFASAVVAGALAGGVLVCARPAIAHWVGDANVVDSSTFWCLVGVFLVQAVLIPYDVLLTATSEHRRYGLMATIEAAVNLTLSVALVGPFGVVAVAGATLFGRLATTGPILLRGSARLLGMRLYRTAPGLRAVLFPVLGSVVVMLWMRHVLGVGLADLALTTVAGLATYAAALPVFAFRRR